MDKKNFQIKPLAVFIIGPTASEKTKLAIELKKQLPIFKIISVDSALIYKGMDIGTAKPTLKEQKIAPHKLIDILDPSQSYSVENFRNDALTEMKQITKSCYIPLLVGGSMLYFKSLINGLSKLPKTNLLIRKKIKEQAKKYSWNKIHENLKIIDPISARRIHPNDSQRISRALEIFLISGKNLTDLTKKEKIKIPYKMLQFLIFPKNRNILHQKIKMRFLNMIDQGFEEEVKMLKNRKDLNKNLPSMRTIGYRQMWEYLSNKINKDEMIIRSISATRQLAKRQISWMRKWEKAYVLNTEYGIENTIKKIIQKIKQLKFLQS